MGAPGVCGAPTMQLASPGSVHSSSRVPQVSWYQTGNPLVSLIGPTAFRPEVPLLCAGGGASAWEATIAPEAAIANAAAPTVRVRRLRVMRASLFIAFSLQMTLRAVRSTEPESWVVSRCSRPCELVLRFGCCRRRPIAPADIPCKDEVGETLEFPNTGDMRMPGFG